MGGRRHRAPGGRPSGRAPDAFAALADPTRRRLLELLRTRDRPVYELAEVFQVSRPAVSQHLRVLLDAGLVLEARHGRERRYRLRASPLRDIFRWVQQYERFWDARLARLGQVLNREAAREKHPS